MDIVCSSASAGTPGAMSDDMEGLGGGGVLPHLSAIKTEQGLPVNGADEAGNPNVAMGIKFILPNRFDMNVCSRFVKSLNEEDSKNIQDQVNSDLEVASVLFKAECNIQASPSAGVQVRHVYTPSTTKHFSPIKQSTTLTNKHRGNEVSSTPLLVHCTPAAAAATWTQLSLAFAVAPHLLPLLGFLSCQLCPSISWRLKARWSFWPAGLSKSRRSTPKTRRASLLSCGRRRTARSRWWSFCSRMAPIPTCWPKDERALCRWPAAKDTRTSSRCSSTAASTSTSTTGTEARRCFTPSTATTYAAWSCCWRAAPIPPWSPTRVSTPWTWPWPWDIAMFSR